MHLAQKPSSGFTLIELSIVLIIIGLIVGGVLVGQDLIRAAAIRAQLSQIEKINTAVNTFRGKYNYLPGDIPNPDASNFGFIIRGTNAGQGDGNDKIEGNSGNCGGCNFGFVFGAGETVTFWADLSTAKLIDGSFVSASQTANAFLSSTGLSSAFPKAAIGSGNYIYAFSRATGSNVNLLGLSGVTSVTTNGSCYACMTSNASLTVRQAYEMDKKVDDGIANAGKVIAFYADATSFLGYGFSSNAPASSGSTCFESSNNTYSINQNNGNGINCGLSFTIQ